MSLGRFDLQYSDFSQSCWTFKITPQCPPVSYALVSRASPVSYVQGSYDSQTKFLQIVDNYVTYNM